MEQRSEKRSHAHVGPREELSMSEHQEIISREHIRVASRELPWVKAPERGQPQRGCGFRSALNRRNPVGVDLAGAVHPG